MPTVVWLADLKDRDLIIREIELKEAPLLEEFLYQAIFIPPRVEAPDRSIIEDPSLSIYVSEFGKRDGDLGLVAVNEGVVIGAIWTQFIRDFGYVDDATPSLSMSVLPNFRGQGVGTALLEKMLAHLKEKGFSQVSLSVQKANYAVEMYRKAGFTVLFENAEDHVMVCKLYK